MATITWNPADYGEWTNTLDWIGGIVPGAGDTAIIAFPSATGDSVVIAAGTSIAVGTIVGTEAYLTVYGTLAIGGAATFESGSLVVNPGAVVGGTIDLTGSKLGGDGYGYAPGTLDAVTLVGTPVVAGSLDIEGGLTLLAATAELNGGVLYSAGFDFLGDQTLTGHLVDVVGTLSTNGTLTIAAGTTLDDAGGNLLQADTTGDGFFVNDGTILALTLGTLDMVNNGQITLDGQRPTGFVDYDDIGTFDNAGTLVLSGGDTLTPFFTTNAGEFSNSGLIEVGTGSTLYVAYGGRVTTVPTLDNNGGTISLDAGGALLPQAVSGGTIRSGGGTIEGSALDNLTVAGSVMLLGRLGGGGIDFAPIASATPAIVTLAATNSDDVGYIEANGALTFETGTTIAFDTAEQEAFSITGASLDFGGVVDALPGGTLTIQAMATNSLDVTTYGTLENSGTIETAAGETLIMSVAGIQNSGLISLVAGATLEFLPDTGLAALAAIQNDGGVIQIGGTLDATGQTVTLTPDSILSQVTILPDAILQGGTFVEAGGAIPNVATLSATTWRGGLDLSAVAQITVENGLTVQDTAGGPGLLSLAGSNTQLTLGSDTTLDNMTIAIGDSLTNPGSADISGIDYPYADLTLGSHTVVTMSGNLPLGGFFGGGTLTNAGTIHLKGTGSVANDQNTPPGLLQSPIIINDGSIIDDDDDAAIFTGQAVQGGTPDSEPSPSDSWQALSDYWDAKFFQPLFTMGAPRQGVLAMSSVASISTLTPEQLAGIAEQEGSIAGTGTITANTGAFIDFDSRIAAGQTLAFGGADAGMAFTDVANVDAKIVNFGSGDVIDLPLFGYASGSIGARGGDVIIPGASGNATLDLGLAPGLSTTQLVAVEDLSGGTALVVACFAEGTRIATPGGPVAVERLREGDMVCTASGEARPVVWTGHRHVAPRRHPRPRDMQPVRIVAGAFAEGVPDCDVRLSPDHAVLVDGRLIPVRLLVNDVSIVREDVAAVTYWHVELPRHDVLLAEGLPCESFLDAGNRAAFVGGGAALELHPAFGQRVWDGAACAPLALSGPAVAKARGRLAGRLAHNLDQSLGFGYDSLCRRS